MKRSSSNAFVIFMAVLCMSLFLFWRIVYRRLKESVRKANTIILILPANIVEKGDFIPKLKRFIAF